jgi:hypothetical protein
MKWEYGTMQLFHDSKLIKTNFNCRSTLFLWSPQKKTAQFFPFLHKLGQNNCTNSICSHGDTYINPLYCIGHLSQFNMYPVVTGSHTSVRGTYIWSIAYIWDVVENVCKSDTCVWHYNGRMLIQDEWPIANTTVEIFIVRPLVEIIFLLITTFTSLRFL